MWHQMNSFTRALAREVENLSQVDVRPNLGPLRHQVAVEGLTELVGGGLETSLKEIFFAEPEVRHRTPRIGGKRPFAFAN
jgi:hypothetical protein